MSPEKRREAVGSAGMKPVSEPGSFWCRIPMALASALVIAGCATKESYLIIDPQPDGITIQHDSRYGTMAGVDADKHCAKYGKRAVFAGTIRPDDATLLRFPDATQTVYDCVAAKTLD